MWMGWNAQRRSKCCLCGRVLGYFNDKPTCGTCYKQWVSAGGLQTKSQVDKEEAKWLDESPQAVDEEPSPPPSPGLPNERPRKHPRKPKRKASSQ